MSTDPGVIVGTRLMVKMHMVSQAQLDRVTKVSICQVNSMKECHCCLMVQGTKSIMIAVLLMVNKRQISRGEWARTTPNLPPSFKMDRNRMVILCSP